MIKTTYDYKRVVIKSASNNGTLLNSVENRLSKMRSENADELRRLTEDLIKVVWFSKFSNCLPEPLAKKAICEKSLDIVGLIKNINLVKINALS